MLAQVRPIFTRSVVPVAILIFVLSNFPISDPFSVYDPGSPGGQVSPVTAVGVPEAAIATNLNLRILVPAWPDAPELSTYERQLLDQFTLTEGLTQMWIPVKDPAELQYKLVNNEADIVVSLREPMPDASTDQILYTLPWAVSRRQLIGRAGGYAVESLSDLTVRQIAVRESSPVWPLLSGLAHKHPGMELLSIPENIDVDTILDRVKTGRYDLAVVDSLLLPTDLDFSYNLKVLKDLSEDLFLNWGVRADAVALHKSLNRFLNKKHLELETGKSYREDFASLKKRKLLRLVTYLSPVNYFHDRGRLKGFEYDLMKKFAEHHGMRLDVVIAETQQEMQRFLVEGKGDVIAASVPEALSASMPNTGFTRPYNYASAVLTGREGETITDIRELEGRVIQLAPSSPYLQTLQRIRDQGINFSILVAAPGTTTETVLFRIAQGIYDLTVIGSHEINVELSRQLNLQTHISLGDPQAMVWLVRQSNTQLLSELNEFIESEYRKGFYNVIYARYIDKPSPRNIDNTLLARIDELSPYDEIVHKYADDYSFDWRLIVALMYQESRFNPAAVSVAGAEGLMQVLPTTAEMIGVTDLNDPDKSIYAGVRYLDLLRGQFENELTLANRLWFALAAYNAGYNRVQRARNLAEKMNLDKNQWFNNVELAMLKMARPYMNNGEQVRDCRCGQTVVYVREIRTLYNNYLRLTRSIKAAAETALPNEKS